MRPGYFPENVPFADEIPLAFIPDIEAWSENFCFTGYDHKNHVGYFLHVGRWLLDPTMWREQVFFYMPDGSVLCNRTFIKGEAADGPPPGNLQMTCLEAGKRWRLTYHGPAQPVTLPELLTGPVRDATEYRLVDMDLEFEGTSPVWYFGEKENTSWGNWHIEQHGHVKGHLKAGDKEWNYEGGGYRDHSRGPRMLRDLRGHCWIQVRFPDGQKVASFQLWQDHDGVEVEDLSEATVSVGNIQHPAIIEVTPRLMHIGDILDRRDLVVSYDNQRLELECIPVSTVCFSVGPVFTHTVLGVASGNVEWPVTVFNQPAIFIAKDGKRGEGWIERCLYRHDKPYHPEYVNRIYAERR